METWMFVLIGVVVFWLLMSLKTIKETERGVFIFIGKVKKMLKPGLHFCPWLFSSVKIYEMTPMIFDLKIPTAITKNGRVEGYKEDGKEIEKVEVDIFLTLTTYFSDEEVRLCETARRATGNNPQSLGPVIAPYVKDVVRSIFGEMPWVLSYQERENVLAYITSKIIPNHSFPRLGNVIKKIGIQDYNFFCFEKENVWTGIGKSEIEMNRYNPLVQFKLDMTRTSISITDINFCDPVLAKSLTLAETARLKADADASTSEQETKRIKDEGLAKVEVEKVKGFNDVEIERVKGINVTEATRKAGFDKADFTRQEGLDIAELTKLQGIAETEVIKIKGVAYAKAREEMIAVIKANPDLESLRTLVEMAQGTSNTILYGLPAGMSDKLSQILGGNKPENLLGLLKDPEILKVLKEAFEKITK